MSGKMKEVMYILMEYCPAGELIEFLLHTGSFSDRMVRAYFKQLLDGVQACLVEGISHRDIKPENLLLDSNFNLISKLLTSGFQLSRREKKAQD